MIKAFPKILQAVGKYADLVVGHDVEITEKIDGSQFAFGKTPDGKLVMRSKGVAINPEEGLDKLFAPAVNHVLSIQNSIPNDTAFYCETLCRPRHNTLEYERVPKNNLMMFGATDYHQTMVYDRSGLESRCADFDIEPVPIVYSGRLEKLEDLKQFLDRISTLGKAHIEGVVVRNYNMTTDYFGSVVPFASVKYVSEQFKEKHADNKDWASGKSKVEELFEAYRTEARWQKAVQHLRDKGELAGEPRDIGALIKELHLDLMEEEQEDFKNKLYQIYSKDWKAVVTRGFPEWYKNQLLSSSGA